MTKSSEHSDEFSFGRYLRPERSRIAALAVLTLLAAQAESAGLLLVAPLAQAISSGADDVHVSLGPFDLKAQNSTLAALAFGFIVVAATFTIAAVAVRSSLVSRKLREQRDRLVASFTQANWGYQSTDRAARLQVLNSFAHSSGRALMAVSQGLRAALSLSVFATFAFIIDWRSTLFISIVGALLSAALWPLVRISRRFQGRLADEFGTYGQELAECGEQARELRVYDANRFVRARLAERSSRLRSIERRSALLSGIVTPLYQYAAISSIVVVLLVMDAGSGDQVVAVAAVALLLLRSLSFAQQLQSAVQQAVETLPYLERFDSAVSAYESERDADDGVELGTVEYLHLRDVSYDYTNDEQALRGIDLRIEAGDAVGVVGPSGSGKSTLAQILLRLREPSTGRYEINGRSARAFSAGSFYNRVTHVPQDSQLLVGTLAENIAFLDPDVARADIVDAAKRVGMHDFVMTLPGGYDTEVGPGSRALSGGQVQRVGIARALIRNPDVLVLDEPTSALDIHTESVIQETLANLPEGMSLVVIAHRLSTIRACDRVVVLEDGEVAAHGAFESVYETNAFFRRSVDLGRLDISTPASESHP